MVKNPIYGISKDKSHFCEFCPEVIAEKAKFPELSIEAAIGNCVTEQDKEFVEVESAPEAPAEPETV